MSERWLAKRTATFEASGIRKVFDLGAKLTNPINLSIGQPDFDMPQIAKEAAYEAIRSGKSGYTPTQGIAPLIEKLEKQVHAKYAHADRKVFISSGTSGSLCLTLMVVAEPGDEVIFFDPYFVMYDALIKMVGATPVVVDTYPDFRFDIQKLADAITPRTKAIIFNSPANPHGKVATREEVQAVAQLAQEKDILLISDEIYNQFCYKEFISPAEYNQDVLVLDGFSKTYGMPGWRVGFAHGPSELVEQMLKFQQYTFVCAPSVGQIAALAALDVDMGEQIKMYERRRDMLYNALKEDYEIVKPEGAFYMFPKAPWGTANQFVETAINEYSMLIIPGDVFSRKDTHFRISYAASEATIERGIEAFRQLAKKKLL